MSASFDSPFTQDDLGFGQLHLSDNVSTLVATPSLPPSGPPPRFENMLFSFSVAPPPSSDVTTSKPAAGRRKQNHIPRPPNAFMIYRALFRRMNVPSRFQPNQKNVSKQMGENWRRMSPEDKRVYVEMAKEAYKEHKLEHPDYIFQPRKRETPKKRRKVKSDSKTALDCKVVELAVAGVEGDALIAALGPSIASLERKDSSAHWAEPSTFASPAAVHLPTHSVAPVSEVFKSPLLPPSKPPALPFDVAALGSPEALSFHPGVVDFEFPDPFETPSDLFANWIVELPSIPQQTFNDMSPFTSPPSTGSQTTPGSSYDSNASNPITLNGAMFNSPFQQETNALALSLGMSSSASSSLSGDMFPWGSGSPHYVSMSPPTPPNLYSNATLKPQAVSNVYMDTDLNMLDQLMSQLDSSWSPPFAQNSSLSLPFAQNSFCVPNIMSSVESAQTHDWESGIPTLSYGQVPYY